MPKLHIATKNSGQKIVTIKIAADLLGLSTRTLRNWDKNGRLKPMRNVSHYRMYKISDLLKLVRADGKLGGLRPKRQLTIDD